MQYFDKVVYTFSADNEPTGTIDSGEIVIFRTQDCFSNQMHSESQLVTSCDYSKMNPATGPLFVRDAQPGDVIKVELLEATKTAGGNGNFSDCVFTFGSPQQIAGAEKAGVTVTADQIIRSEIELYDYTIDGELWVDVIEHSADNTQWLLDAGCHTEDIATFYGGTLGKTPTVLMWRDGVGGGMTSAMEPMLATLKGLGVEPRLETRGQALKMNDAGEACGVYAETKDGVLEINAKAVIFSGGGWAASPEMLATYGGYDMDKTDIFCCEGCVGDTLKMAAAAGARQDAVSRGYMFGNAITGITSSYVMQYHPALWVNGDGRRFANEDCGEVCHDYTGTAVRSQEAVYVILDDAMIAEMDKNSTVTTNAEGQQSKSLKDEIDAAAADSANADVVSAASIDELAKKIEGATGLAETFATYQQYCAQGHDDLFGKDPQYLVALAEGPLYALRVHQTICLSLGGINTNRFWQVVDEAKGTHLAESLSAEQGGGQNAAASAGKAVQESHSAMERSRQQSREVVRPR